jgi:hypothetical protein
VERTDVAQVTVNVIRDNNPPFFINEPYETQISENIFNTNNNNVIYTRVSARDTDLQVKYFFPTSKFFMGA